MTSKPTLIHYGLAPFEISTAPFKMLMRIFRVPDLLFIIRVFFIHMGKRLLLLLALQLLMLVVLVLLLYVVLSIEYYATTNTYA